MPIRDQLSAAVKLKQKCGSNYANIDRCSKREQLTSRQKRCKFFFQNDSADRQTVRQLNEPLRNDRNSKRNSQKRKT